MKFLKLVFIDHDPLALGLIAWALTVALYVVLQIWFAYAWAGRWRIAALVPLIGVVLSMMFFVVVQSKIPDAPPFESVSDFLRIPGAGLNLVFAPGVRLLGNCRNRTPSAQADHELKRNAGDQQTSKN